MSHYKQVCQFGIVHAQCRCPGPVAERRVTCDRPTEHRGKLAEMHAANRALIPAPPQPFQPGDLVRHHYAGLGTVVEPDPDLPPQPGITRVKFHDPRYEFPMTLVNPELRLAGTRCIPFEAMSTPDQWFHLRFLHHCTPRFIDTMQVAFGTVERSWRRVFERTHDSLNTHPEHHPVPHTHRKQPPAIMVCPGGQVAADHNGDPCCRLCGWNQPPRDHPAGINGQVQFAALVMQPHPDYRHPEYAMYRPEGGRL